MNKQPQPTKSAVVTEEEAQLKNCPNELTCSCIGSRCMAWRWIPGKPYWQGEGSARREVREQPIKGFCGLAGAPL